MTHFLVSETNPDGSKLEDILRIIRDDILLRCTKINADVRPEAQLVLANNVRILGMLTDAIDLAEESTRTLDKSFGPGSVEGPPRIGTD